MNKKYIPWILLGIWILAFVALIEIKARSFAMLMPIFLLGGIIYMVVSTIKTWPKGFSNNEQENNENKENNEKQ